MLMTGPDLTEKLLDTLVRFRAGSYEYSAEISKAFLCLSLQECDRDLLGFSGPKILDPEAKLLSYRFKGKKPDVTSSPFLLRVTLYLYFRISTGQYNDII